jgi:nitroreductase
METLEAIKQRHSVREFAEKPIPKEIIEKIVDAGRLAPSARRVEPWEFIAVTEKETREKLAHIAEYGKFIAQASCCIAVFCKETKYYLEDGCAATENILIAATDLGVDSCWVAGDKKPYCGEVASILGIPQEYKLISLIALGYSKKETKPLKKRELKDVLHWERFGKK